MNKQLFSCSPRTAAFTIVSILTMTTILSLSAASTRVGPASGRSTVDLAHGAGTTYVQGGTGAGTVGSYPSYTPVLTKLGFHAESNNGVVTGSLDCLALAPESTSGVFTSESATFTVNVMYVTGAVTG